MFFPTGDPSESKPSSSSSVQDSQSCRHFKFSEIQLATDNFDESLVIGHGGFGKVYKGNIINGSSVVVAAIKRLDSMSNQGASEFWAEVEMLSKLRHCNLVSLFGYCNHEKEMILVYEYMPNGTLEDHLHRLCTPFSWLQRLKICIDAGRGLHYLHTGTGIKIGVIHRDVKSSNILLNETWAAKISDFGLSKKGPTDQPSTYVNTNVKGTFGYLDPDYFYTGRLTRKSDVYAFGVVLLEVLCRKRAVDRSLDEEQWNLAKWVQESIKEGNFKHIIDPGLRGQISPKCFKEFVQIAETCLHSDPKQRLTMAEVLVSLGRMVDRLPYLSNTDKSGIFAEASLASSIAHVSHFIRRRITLRSQMSAQRLLSAATGSFNVQFYSLSEVKRATNSFSRKRIVSIGTYGAIYAGKLDHDEWVSINRIPYCDIHQVMHEIKILSPVSHQNIVRLLGCCVQKDEKILIYEFMPNGTLSQHLQREIGNGLPWMVRLTIATEIAQAIAYLHSAMNPPHYHRNIVSSSILLDNNYRSKFAVFGLSSLSMSDESHLLSPQGTSNYVDPQYGQNFLLDGRNNVYSFGVVLLEIITALKVVDLSRCTSEVTLAAFAIDKIVRGCVNEIIDPLLEPNKDAYTLSSVHKVAELAFRCLAYCGDSRPSMREVADELERIRLGEQQ